MTTLEDVLTYAHMRNCVQRPPFQPMRYTVAQDTVDRVKLTKKQLRRLCLVLGRLQLITRPPLKRIRIPIRCARPWRIYCPNTHRSLDLENLTTDKTLDFVAIQVALGLHFPMIVEFPELSPLGTNQRFLKCDI